jgi:hypothetical protein
MLMAASGGWKRRRFKLGWDEWMNEEREERRLATCMNVMC